MEKTIKNKTKEIKADWEELHKRIKDYGNTVAITTTRFLTKKYTDEKTYLEWLKSATELEDFIKKNFVAKGKLTKELDQLASKVLDEFYSVGGVGSVDHYKIVDMISDLKSLE